MKELFLSEPNIIYAESFKNYALAYKKINNGQFLESIFNKEDKEYMLKYSITLTNN